MANITFSPQTNGTYKATMQVSSDFKLHIETSAPSDISVYQKDPDGNNYDIVGVYKDKTVLDSSFGDPYKAYPLSIMLVCTSQPSQSFYKEL